MSTFSFNHHRQVSIHRQRRNNAEKNSPSSYCPKHWIEACQPVTKVMAAKPKANYSPCNNCLVYAARDAEVEIFLFFFSHLQSLRWLFPGHCCVFSPCVNRWLSIDLSIMKIKVFFLCQICNSNSENVFVCLVNLTVSSKKVIWYKSDRFILPRVKIVYCWQIQKDDHSSGFVTIVTSPLLPKEK